MPRAEVAISTNYNGVNPTTATWTTLPATIANSGCGSGYAPSFVPSGNVDLSSFSGTGYIAFIYNGNNSSQTTTYQVDNVKID